MLDTRRSFLNVLAGAGTLAFISASRLVSQTKQQTRPPVPPPADEGEDPDALPGKSPTKLMLEENQKDIKKNVDKLYQLVTDLKAQVDKTDSSQVLSLALVKKADEIERLARDIKARAKG